MPQRPSEPHRPFPTTHWSLVAEAGGGSGASKRKALVALLESYLPAMRAHLVYRKRLDADRAEDWVQGFLASRVLEQDLIAAADRSKGKFRTFLLTALDRYIFNDVRDQNAAKRSPAGRAALDESLDAAYPSAVPGDAFDLAWAREVLDQTVRRMREECDATGRADIWGVFEGRTLLPALRQAEPVPYPLLVDRFGFASPAQASNALITANRMFARVLRSVVGAYEKSGDQVEDEIHDLWRILSRPGAGSP